jgi:hypothetical protein
MPYTIGGTDGENEITAQMLLAGFVLHIRNPPIILEEDPNFAGSICAAG